MSRRSSESQARAEAIWNKVKHDPDLTALAIAAIEAFAELRGEEPGVVASAFVSEAAYRVPWCLDDAQGRADEMLAQMERAS